MKLVITLTLSALLFSAPAVVNTASAQPSSIPGQACEVNWTGGACGETANNGSDGSTVLSHVREKPCGRKGAEPCDCEHDPS